MSGKVRVVVSARERTPLWVKVVGIVAIVLVVLLGVMLLTGRGGSHGPGRHAAPGDAGTPAASAWKDTRRPVVATTQPSA